MPEWQWELEWVDAYHLRNWCCQCRYTGPCEFSRIKTILVASVSDIPKELRYV